MPASAGVTRSAPIPHVCVRVCVSLCVWLCGCVAVCVCAWLCVAVCLLRGPPSHQPHAPLHLAVLSARYGVIVDGFPRTFIQAECIKLLHARMMELRDRSMHDEDENLRGAVPCWPCAGPVCRRGHLALAACHATAKMRRPVFHITVLYVDEEESIKRQMQRAAKVSAVVPSVPWRQHSFLVVYHFAHRAGAASSVLPTVYTTSRRCRWTRQTRW